MVVGGAMNTDQTKVEKKQMQMLTERPQKVFALLSDVTLMAFCKI